METPYSKDDEEKPKVHYTNDQALDILDDLLKISQNDVDYAESWVDMARRAKAEAVKDLKCYETKELRARMRLQVIKDIKDERNN